MLKEQFANFVSIVCLTSLLLMVITTAITILIKRIKSRPDGISYIRDFKRGKCGIVFVPALVLFLMDACYSGNDLLEGLFKAIEMTLKLITLSYEPPEGSALMGVNTFYTYAVYACCVVVLLNAILFFLSLAAQWIWSLGQRIKTVLTRKNRLLLIGNNPENKTIYRSETHRNGMILETTASIDRKQLVQDKEQLYMDNIPFRYVHSLERELVGLLYIVKLPFVLQNALQNSKKKLPSPLKPKKNRETEPETKKKQKSTPKTTNKKRKEWILVVNTLDDKRNISFCSTIVDAIEGASGEVQDKIFARFKVFVFGDPRYEAIYGDIARRSHGCIQYINKHQRIAMDFIDRYPFTKFMDENQIDYASSLVKENVDINAIFLGFGKTNQQIFLTSVANNQFLTGSEEEPRVRPVNYHIFDKNPAENNKNLNHSYYRYRNEFFDKNENLSLERELYLPLPAFPAKEHYYHLDINSQDFYGQIKKIVSGCKKCISFIVIAFGDDLENLDMAQKLIEKRREWEISNLIIFVKVRSWHKEQTILKDECCYFIGHEQDVVYNIEKIIGDDLYKMAQLRNEVYDLEYNVVNDPSFVLNAESVANNHAQANQGWYQKKTALQRESNLYCCLSLRSKLNLMGLDYCKKTSPADTGMDAQVYLTYYAGNDLPDTTRYAVKANGKAIVHYSLDFRKSRRRTMAIHEHARWNAFMISKGLIPASLKQILEEKNSKGKYTNGNNSDLRHHGNLTTYEGLTQFRKIVAQRDKVPEETKDVIKYDYQLLDDAYWLLNKLDYKIIPHTKLQ